MLPGWLNSWVQLYKRYGLSLVKLQDYYIQLIYPIEYIIL